MEGGGGGVRVKAVYCTKHPTQADLPFKNLNIWFDLIKIFRSKALCEQIDSLHSPTASTGGLNTPVENHSIRQKPRIFCA